MNNSFSLNIRGKLKKIDRPWVMGILNVTPDSFYEGSRLSGTEAAVNKAKSMIEEGADCLDIGGYSSRPGADEVSENEELHRVIPVIEAIHHTFPKVIISIDTFRSNVGRASVAAGASIINDISGGEADKNMFATVKELNVPYILMHMAGNPKTMQNNPSYKNVVKEVYTSLGERVSKLRQMGVADVIIDPGFGFGKTLEHNYALLKGLSYFQGLNCPILAGLSRKSMIYKPLNITASESLNGTAVLHTYALEQGSQILRVHDVKEAKQVVDLYSLMNREEYSAPLILKK